jgi:hydrogenase maturation protease
MSILIACIGNIFFGDDAFGCEVAQRLSKCELPSDVTVVDFGIRGYDLAMRLEDKWDAIVFVDAMPSDHPPGTLSVIEPSLTATPATTIDPHGLDPVRVLQLAYRDRPAPTLRLVAVAPQSFDLEMSTEVTASIDPAVALVQRLIAELPHA